MGTLKTGAFLGSFRLDFKSALARARDIGLDGLQLSNLEGAIDVENITPAQAKEIRELFRAHGLAISAVCGDIGGFSIEDAAEAARRVERTRRIMENTRLLEVDIVQTHIGFIPADFTEARAVVLKDCLERIGRHGEETGVFLATETGPEPADRMKIFLDDLAVPAVKVNYDPANLVMKGFDCLDGVFRLRDYIIHTHAKDGRAEPDALGRREQPLGQGDVDFDRYIAALKEIGYRGFFVIEREVGDDPAADIAEAKRFLDRF